MFTEQQHSTEASILRTRLLRVAVAAGLAVAAASLSVLSSAPVASANGPCSYTTIDNAYVRETPSLNSVVRKTKPANSVVTGPFPCWPRTGTDGRRWVPVDCTCATDGIGWIISDKLVGQIES